MKILRAISSADPSGGGPIEGILRSSEALADLDVQVELVTLDAPNSSWVSSLPLTTHALGPSSGGYRYSSKFIPWMKENGPKFDRVIVSGLWQFTSYGTYLALRSRMPYYVFPHGMLDPWFKHTYPGKHIKKLMYWSWAEYKVLKEAAAVLFTSEDERVLASQSFKPYEVRERVVSYGSSGPVGDRSEMLAKFNAAFPALAGKKFLLFMGRIHPKKGCDLLLTAFVNVLGADPEWDLVFAGPDQVDWVRALQEQARRSNLSNRVHWLGMISGDLKWGAYLAAEALALPSHQENFGMVVAEALSCGLPTLISDKVNIWREIEHAKCGIVSEDTLEGTTNSLRKWISITSSEANEMRFKATECFQARFEIQMAARSLIEATNG